MKSTAVPGYEPRSLWSQGCQSVAPRLGTCQPEIFRREMMSHLYKKTHISKGSLLVGWLVGWLVGRSVGWLVGWSVGWLVGCLQFAINIFL